MENSHHDFVTIATFNHPYEVAIIRIKLDSAGIDTFLKDELTTHIYPFSSNAVGGVKLQVRNEDLEAALEILENSGHPTNDEDNSSGFLNRLALFTGQIPLLKRIRFEGRFLIIATLLFSSVIGIIYVIAKPTPYEKFTENDWCVVDINYQNTQIQPMTQEFVRLVQNGFCPEKISFRDNGAVFFPGLNSRPIKGEWNVNDSKLEITRIDTFAQIFEGEYDFSFAKNNLILESAKTKIKCSVDQFRY